MVKCEEIGHWTILDMFLVIFKVDFCLKRNQKSKKKKNQTQNITAVSYLP